MGNCWNILLIVKEIFVPPQNLQTYDEKGDFLIKTKKKGMLYGIHYGIIRLM